MRSLIFGNSGSGKSTLARQLRSLGDQAWVAGYYERNDPWSYRAHRRIFDAFEGRKIERTLVGALPS